MNKTIIFVLLCSSILINSVYAQLLPGIEVSRISGNTVAKGREARFKIALTTEPTGNVTIPLESSDPLEGVPLVDSVTFSPLTWMRPIVVRVKGTNPDVINSEQDYRIVLGPVVSDDPDYNGLDPDDVEVKGLSLTVLMDDLYFVSELDQRSPFIVHHNGHGRITHQMTSDTAEASIYGQHIEWNPPKSAEGIRHIIDIQSTLNGKAFENNVYINVLSSTTLQLDDVASNEFENLLEVTTEGSSLKGLILGSGEGTFSGLELREVNIDILPKTPRERLLTSGLLINEDGPIDLYVPVSIVPNASDLGRLEYYFWDQGIAGIWLPHSRKRHLIEIDGKRYVKFLLDNASQLGVIALRPKPK